MRRKILTVYGGEIDVNVKNVTTENKYFSLSYKNQSLLDNKYQKDLPTTWLKRGVSMWLLKGEIIKYFSVFLS